MELIGWFVLIPLSLAALLTGLIQSLGTPWGLFKHWWVLVKFLMTVVATFILIQHMKSVSQMAEVASTITLSEAHFRSQQIQLFIHALGGLAVLFTAAWLSVYKPWGKTPHGRRQSANVLPPFVSEAHANADLVMARAPGPAMENGTPRWMRIVGFHAIGRGVLFVVLHLMGGGMRHH
jgi:hypothetical protein